MFITVKRHEREIQDVISASKRLTDAVLKTSTAGLFLLDSKGKIQPQVSTSLGTLFRRQDFANLTLEKLIGPVVSAKTLSVARAYITRLLDSGRDESQPDPMQDVEVRLANSDGSFESAHYCFEFSVVDVPQEPRSWMVRVAEIRAYAWR